MCLVFELKAQLPPKIESNVINRNFFILFILVFRILIRIVSAIPGSFRSILFCSAGTEESHQSEYGQVYILMSHDIVFLPTWILS